MGVIVGGEEVELLPERAVWWPKARTLLVADLHWGKVETFHTHGIPVPSGILADDLARLSRAVDRTRAERLLVLGDMVHGRLLPAAIDEVAAWRVHCPTRLVLVRGNHDRHAPHLPTSWAVEEYAGVLREGPFAFTHAPAATEGAYTWAGHIHPMVTLRGRSDALRLPCFHVGVDVGVLPAFGAFTGGVPVRRRPGDRVFVVAEGEVIVIPAPAQPLRRGGRA